MKRRGPSALVVAALVIGPALLVAAGYAWWIGLPLRKQVADVEQQIVDMQASLPTAERIAEVNGRVDELRAELAAIVAERAPAADQRGRTFVPSPERAQWRLSLSHTLQRHKLALIGEERSDLQLPPNVARGLTGATSPRTSLPVWTLELRGAYLDLLAAVTELRGAQLPVHLLELGMKRNDAGVVTWRLVVG